MPKKTDEEKAEERRTAEARRQDGKSRSAHEAARGSRLPTLSELSREWPTREQVFDFGNLVGLDANDRAGVIMAAALVEQALLMVVSIYLPNIEVKVQKEWFEDANAPFGSFSSKIKLGRALAIYGARTESDLIVIKNIRNVFAHRSLPLDFSHPSIQKEALKLKSNEEKTQARGIYYENCSRLVAWFTKAQEEKVGERVTTRLP